MQYYYISKNLAHLLNIFFFKRMVIEMLLNSDIKKKIVQIILNFQKKINVIMYIIEKKFKFKFNHFM
jgi:hypothetical protein